MKGETLSKWYELSLFLNKGIKHLQRIHKDIWWTNFLQAKHNRLNIAVLLNEGEQLTNSYRADTTTRNKI